MLRKFIPLILLFPLLAFTAGERYLNKIDLYQRDSYFKQKAYTDNINWKGFYQLKDAQAIVNPDNYDFHLLSAAVFFATNKMRESKRAKPLQFSPPLRDASAVHTSQMIEKNFFDHYNRLTPALRTPDQRLKLFGISSSAYAENVDYTFIPINSNTTYLQLAEQIVRDFYNSPPHRKNMLGKEYTHLGCSAIFEARNQQGVRYVKATQDFSADY